MHREPAILDCADGSVELTFMFRIEAPVNLADLHIFRLACGKTMAVFVVAIALAFTITCAVPVLAQSYTGSLAGTVTDSTGANIPNAKITLTDVGKQYDYSGQTDGEGRYLLRSLPPSTYRLLVTAQGFNSFLRNDIVLGVAQNAMIEVRLSVESVKQQVVVTAAAPLMETEDATTGQEVDQTFIQNLPSIGREVMDLTFLAAGVNPAPGQTFGSLNNNIGVANNFTSNGGRNATAAMLIDGGSAMGNDATGALQEPLYTPSPDAVQEFKVEQNNFSAELGFTGSTIINIVTKSGTNVFHGSAYEYWRNQVMDANNWFNGQQGIPTPPLRYNDFGFTVGGPIRHNKTFFFGDYEGNRVHTMSNFTAGVPSTNERGGDFGEICGYAGGSFNAAGMCSQPGGQIWDPYSGVYNPSAGGAVLNSFIPFNNMATYASPGNPNLNGTLYQLSGAAGDLIDPVASRIMSYFPLPNAMLGAGYNPYANWVHSGVNISGNDQFDIKIDQRFGEKNLLSGRFSWGRSPLTEAQCFGNALDPCSAGPQLLRPTSVALNDTHTFGSHTIMVLGLSYIHLNSTTAGVSAAYPDFNAAKELGLPGYMSSSGVNIPPLITLGGSYYQAGSGWEAIGQGGWTILNYKQETRQITGSISHERGAQEFKIGGEVQQLHTMSWQPGTPGGEFNFGWNSTSQYPNGGGGDAMAALLTGTSITGGGQYEVDNLNAESESFRVAGYFQDNWHIKPHLTFNLGLRYEVEVPRTVSGNKVSWIDTNAASPLPALPCPAGEPCLSNLKGGLVYASNGDRHVANTNFKGVLPRVGIAWQLDQRTVVRTGYGIFSNPNQYGAAGSAASVGQVGYDTVTNWISTQNSDGATPWGRLSDPFPSGVRMPQGNVQGLATNLGSQINGTIKSWNILPYTQTWSFGLQHEFPGSLIFEMNYVGTKGTHLYFHGGEYLNHIGPAVENASASEIANLLTYVPNPFYGIITDPTAPLSAPQVQLASLYNPYPQFSQVSTSAPSVAASTYNALQVRLQKRMSNGLQLLSSYVWSKSIDDASLGASSEWMGGFGSLVDPNNYSLERSVSEFNVPQVFNIAWVYELPFGKGQRWGSSWGKFLNSVAGGWKFSGDYRLDNGQPIGLSEQGGLALPGGYGQRPDLLAPLSRNRGSGWINRYFNNPQDAVVAAPYTLGTAPRMLSNINVPGTNSAAGTLSKSFPFAWPREGTSIDFKLESFNALNHPQFCGPNTTVNGGSFGQITAQCNSPREVQLSLRLSW